MGRDAAGAAVRAATSRRSASRSASSEATASTGAETERRSTVGSAAARARRVAQGVGVVEGNLELRGERLARGLASRTSARDCGGGSSRGVCGGVRTNAAAASTVRRVARRAFDKPRPRGQEHRRGAQNAAAA